MLHGALPALPALCLMLCTVAPAAAQGGAASDGLQEALHTVQLARGTSLNVLISRRAGTQPATAVLLFPGDSGILRLREEAGVVSFGLRGNFLVRARRHLASGEVYTVLVDCPVDQWEDCRDTYRSSPTHANDIREVIAALRKQHGARRVYLAGTSYGTVSTSILAATLGAEIDGAIHTATFTDPRDSPNAHGRPMAGFDWSKSTVPQLFVHHRDDPCGVTRYSSVVARRGTIPLITVEGVANPRGPACQARTAHGFIGRERVVMQALHDWITQRRTPAVVGAAD